MLNMPEVFVRPPEISDRLYQYNTDGVKVVILNSMAKMLEWQTPWQELERHSTAALIYFQSFDWCKTWLLHHGEYATPHVIIAIEHGAVVAVWPLMLQRNALGLKALRSIGDPHTQYANILTATGCLNPAVCKAVSDTLQNTATADLLHINYVPAHSALKAILPAESDIATLQNEAAHFDLRQFQTSADYGVQESKSQRRMRKKATTLLSGLGAVRLEVVRPGSAQFAGLVEKCFAMKLLWLQRTGRIGMGLMEPSHEVFLSNLPGSTSALEGTIVFALMAGNKPVAIEFGMLNHGHYYSYLGSFAWGWRHASPGSLQIAKTIDWLIDNGVKTFDLMGNPENYKQTWTSQKVCLSSHIVGFTFRGKCHGAVWISALRPALKKTYRLMPSSLRSAMNMLRKTIFMPVL
jgi:CelD/BcsL family acetyltransferase involved in cellulose biosynthesis